MVTPRSLSNLNQRQVLQLQERGRISSQAAADEIVRRRQAEADRKRRDESRRERIDERTKGRELIERAISTPEARQEAERVIQAQRRQETQAVSKPPVTPTTRKPTEAPRIELQRISPIPEGAVTRVSRSQPSPTGRKPVTRGGSGGGGPRPTDRKEPPLSQFTTGNQVNITNALRAGVSHATLRGAGISDSSIQQEQRRINAVNVLQRYEEDGQIDLNTAVRRVDEPTLERAGITREQITKAKKQNAVKAKLQPYTDSKGNIDLEAAYRAGVERQTLKDAGFSKSDIADAQLRIRALRQLRPYAVQGGGYDIVKAIDENKVSRLTLLRAGFTGPQINEAEELNRNLRPAAGTKEWYLKVGKTIGVTAADAIVPGLWIRNWDNLSNTERATNIALDALFLVPFVGVAAKGAKAVKVAGAAAAASRATARSSKAGKALKAVRQLANRTQADDIATRISRIDAGMAGIKRQEKISELLVETLKSETKARPIATEVRAARRQAIDLRRHVDQVSKEYLKDQRKKLEDLLATATKQPSRQTSELADRIAKVDAAFTGMKRREQIDRLLMKALPAPKTAARTTAATTRSTRRQAIDLRRRIESVSKEQLKGQKRKLEDLFATAPGGPIAKASELADRIARIDATFGEIKRKEQINRLVTKALQSPPGVSQAVQRKAARIQRGINDIRNLPKAEKDRRLKDLIATATTAPTVSRVYDTGLLKTSDEVAKLVLRKTGDAQLADSARTASLKVSEGLATGNTKLFREGAKTLSAIGNRSGLKALTSRFKSLPESKLKDVSDFFKKAGQSGDIPKAPATVKDRISKIDEFFKGADDLDAAAGKAEETGRKLLEQEVRLAEKKLKDLEQRRAGTPKAKQLLKERIQLTKTKLAERPTVSPVLQTLLTPPVAAPLARIEGKAAARTATRGAARVETKSLARAATPAARKAAVKVPIGAKSLVKPVKIQSQQLARVATPPVAEDLARKARIETRQAQAQDQAQKQRQKQDKKLATKLMQEERKREGGKFAAKFADDQKMDQLKDKPARDDLQKKEDQFQDKLQDQFELKDKTRKTTDTLVKTKIRTTPDGTTITPGQKFKLPNEREEKKLKPGEFPRVVTWQQGLFDVTVDIDKGVRSFQKASTTGKKVTPDSTFKIVSKDKTRPTPKVFRQGVVDLTVTPNSLAFKRRTRNGLK